MLGSLPAYKGAAHACSDLQLQQPRTRQRRLRRKALHPPLREEEEEAAPTRSEYNQLVCTCVNRRYGHVMSCTNQSAFMYVRLPNVLYYLCFDVTRSICSLCAPCFDWLFIVDNAVAISTPFSALAK